MVLWCHSIPYKLYNITHSPLSQTNSLKTDNISFCGMQFHADYDVLSKDNRKKRENEEKKVKRFTSGDKILTKFNVKTNLAWYIFVADFFFAYLLLFRFSMQEDERKKKNEINTLKVWNFQWEFIMEIGLQRKENQINGKSVLFFVFSSYIARIETNCDGLFYFICLQLLSFIFHFIL